MLVHMRMRNCTRIRLPDWRQNNCESESRMNGLHIPGTPLVVDYWRLRNVPPRALYFLTHLHADHTSGLSSQWPYPIHCTPITACLLRKKFKIRPELIKELEVGECYLLHVAAGEERERVSVSVTVLDANHCPGSAMFLFEGYFGRILYTGDFRYSPAMAQLPQLVQCSAVDVLYMDNTYCHPSCQFPSREKATEVIVRMIHKNKDRTTLIGLHTLGKEDLLVAIAKQLGVWVGVSPERYETLQLLGADNVFTTDVDSCYVRVLPFHIVLKTVQTENAENSVLGILPTCIFTGKNAPPPPSHPSLKVVPYSDHSSCDELMEFVGVVKPRSIRPIVRCFSGNKNSITSSRCNMSLFDNLLDPTPMTNYEIPDVIAQLISVYRHDDKPHPPAPPPIVKRLSVGNDRVKCKIKLAAGIDYLSPTKDNKSGCGQNESRDYHVTKNKGENGGQGKSSNHRSRCGQNRSHDCHVTENRFENGGLKKHLSMANTKMIVSPRSLAHRIPLEPQSNSHTPEPILPPVVRVLSDPRSTLSHRSDLFYGTEAARQRKRSRSTGSGDKGPGPSKRGPLRLQEGGQRDGMRELPSSVTRPMWVTRLDREWGVAFDDLVASRSQGNSDPIRTNDDIPFDKFDKFLRSINVLD